MEHILKNLTYSDIFFTYYEILKCRIRKYKINIVTKYKLMLK